MTQDPSSSDSFAKIRENYLKGIPGKINSIKLLIGKVHQNPNEKDLSELRTLVHKLAGTAGMFGLQNISTFCKQWVDILPCLKTGDS